jgi:hypothetical protein
MYNNGEKPEKALASIAGIDWARSLSPFGRMQLQRVRWGAYLQLGRKAEADDVFAWLREHRDDAEGSWLSVLLESGDMDGAAALLISRLRDPEKRGDALAGVQEYRSGPALPRQQQSRDRWDRLVTRPDVLAVVDEVGRREKVPLFE